MQLLLQLEETVQKRQRKCQMVTSALQRIRIVHVAEKLDSYFRLGVGRKEYMSDYRKMVLGWGVPEMMRRRPPELEGDQCRRLEAGMGLLCTELIK